MKSLAGCNLISTKRSGCEASSSLFLGIPKEFSQSVFHSSEQKTEQMYSISFHVEEHSLSFQAPQARGTCSDLLFSLHSFGLAEQINAKGLKHFSGDLSHFQGGFQDGIDDRQPDIWACLLLEGSLFGCFSSLRTNNEKKKKVYS